MKTERWKQVDQLFHAALERKPEERLTFLKAACAGRDSLRHEVEVLLAAHDEAGSFMEAPALAVEARGLAVDKRSPEMPLATGETISHYRIISSLGSGGMGVVYLAEDTSLGRKIALKLLPTEFTTDSDRVRRFQQEARAASALNHPNILIIHEIGQAEDRHFIASEFIAGETLRQRMSDAQPSVVDLQKRSVEGHLERREVLGIAMQVADALAAAHAKGIVHRDIKPENIMLIRDSHLMQKESFVKVLDFGIAKLTEQTSNTEADATTRVLLNTHEGSVIGTVNYMSPEQARGEKVDARTDIWSLGIVLYEMLSSEVPFAGNTTQDVIASILKDSLPPISVEVPDRFRWVVIKALRKSKEERYQTAREMFSDLRELHEDENEFKSRQKVRGTDPRSDPILGHVNLQAGLPTKASNSHPTSRITRLHGVARRHPGIAMIVSATLVIAAVGIVYGLYKIRNQNSTTSQNSPKSAAPFQTFQIAKLTTTGKVTDAAISPDGKYVVYVVVDGEKQSVWLRQVSPYSDVQIIPPAQVNYYPGLTFSPDGNYIYYGVWENETNSLYQIPVLGGAKRKLITDFDSVISFSPDGKQFAFLRGYADTRESALFVTAADGSSQRKLAVRSFPNFFNVSGEGAAAWSPDGKIIVCPVRNTDESGQQYMTLVEVRVADGSEKRISSEVWGRVERIAWLRDGSGLVFIARERRPESPSQIWYLAYPAGKAQRITNDLNDYVSVSLTADSSALVSIESEQASNIWISGGENSSAARQITETRFDGVQGISWTPDDKIVYASRVTGNSELWMVDANGTGRTQLTTDGRHDVWPSVSSDGRYVVFVSKGTLNRHIWRMNIDGSSLKQLTSGDDEIGPQITPDGQWVIYLSVSGVMPLLKIPIDGGKPVQIIESTSFGAAISPNGQWIAVRYPVQASPVAVYPFEGGQPQKMLNLPNSSFFSWTPDGRALAYIDPKNFANIISQPIDGGPPKQWTDFKTDRIFNFAWSRDGKQLALARGTLTKDVVLIADFKNPR